MAIEARISPTGEASRYRLDLASRGVGQMMGPSIRGMVDLDTLEVVAELHNFDFRGPVKSMLPTVVQEWLERHELAGRIDIPVFEIVPRKDGSKGWKIVTVVDAVNMAIPPEEWLDVAEGKRVQGQRGFYRMMRRLGITELAGIDLVARGYGSEPIRLSQVIGKFIFTEDGIEVDNISGWLEQNALGITGKIHGYPGYPAGLTAPAFDFHVAAKQIFIPETPFYMASMPPGVREIYERFHPMGKARLTADIVRATPGGPVKTSGNVTVIDTSFCYKMFPYPLEHVSGKVSFGHDDPKTGGDWIRMEDIRCHAKEPSPNAKTTFFCSGYISPLDDTNGIEINARGDNSEIDEGVYMALGPDTRKTIHSFAPAGTEFPRLKGSFDCHVNRPVGIDKEFLIDVDLDIHDAEATYAEFAVPLERVKGMVRVRDDHVDLSNISAKHGDADVAIDGRIETPSGGHVSPDLKITAHNMPLDDDLLAALPEHQRNWIDKAGLNGKFDLDGKLFPLRHAKPRGPATQAAGGDDDFDIEMQITLHEGTIWPVEGVPILTELTGALELKHDQLIIKKFTGKRGQGDVVGHLELLSFDDPRVTVGGTIKNMVLDNTLHQLLSPEAREVWDTVRPEGTVDLDVSYATGGVAEGHPGPTTAPADNYQMVIHPRAGHQLQGSPVPTGGAKWIGDSDARKDRIDRCVRKARKGQCSIQWRRRDRRKSHLEHEAFRNRFAGG